MRLPRVLRAFLAIVSTLWAISLVFAFASSHPLSSFDGCRWIFYPGAAFDYYDYIGRMFYLHRPEFFSHSGYPWYYPAAGIFPLQFFYSIGRVTGSWFYGYLAFILLAIAGDVCAALLLACGIEAMGVPRKSARAFVLGAGFFSWPIYFSLQRGNLEAVTWLVLAAAFWAYGTQRWMIAAVLLGVIAAFKFYPGLCFALFLRPRKWKELFAGLLTTVAVTLAALRYILPDIHGALQGVVAAVVRWTGDYARGYGAASATYDHSLYELLKVLTLAWSPNYSRLLERYLLVAGVLALLAFLARVMHLPRTNQVLFLVTAAVFLPPASFDYTLQNLYVAFGWLVLVAVSEARRGTVSRPVTCSLLLLAFVFGPETFLLWHGMTAAGLLKSVFLLVLLLLSIVCPMPDIEARAVRCSA